MAIKKVKTVLSTPKVAKPTKKELTNWPTFNNPTGGIPRGSIPRGSIGSSYNDTSAEQWNKDHGVDITPLERQPFHNKKKNRLRFSKKKK